MKKKLFLLCTCFFAYISIAMAQVSKVTGVVISEEDNLPIVGASVLIKGTNTGTVTDIDGKFTLGNIPANAKKVIISFIGMQSRELDIKPELNVILKSDTEVLDEVVVTGYGVTKKSTFTGAANVAGSTTLESRTDANFMKALEGSMPGVQMNNSTSMPGAQANVYIRGESSVNSGTQPLCSGRLRPSSHRNRGPAGCGPTPVPRFDHSCDLPATPVLPHQVLRAPVRQILSQSR